MNLSKGRAAGATLIGLLAFALAAAALATTAKAIWPAYASAVPQRAYDPAMLLTRLAGGCVALAGAGAATAAASRRSRPAALALAASLLGLSLAWHIHIWPHYPVWYHL